MKCILNARPWITYQTLAHILGTTIRLFEGRANQAAAWSYLTGAPLPGGNAGQVRR